MKRIGMILLAMVFVMASAMDAQGEKKSSAEGKAILSFEEEVWDFGKIKEKDGSVSHDFEFINSGNGVLVIYDATAECGCTRPEFPQKPIAAGKKGKVKVTFNPKGRRGSFTKVVTVKSNAKQAKTRIKIKGTVE